jgi:16S rRNA (adenine1518-N6/adenine1519-N6)-dimethyltransferase
MHIPPGFKPKKSLGQSFLVSNKIADKLVSALELLNTDTVLEIGAGTGVLTTRLCEKAHKVYAVEIDKRLIPILRENTEQYRNIEIIHEDILNLNWQKFNNIKIIGNIPYYISSEILLKLLDKINLWSIAVLTTQREFAYKLLASPGKTGYCAATLLFEFYTERKKLLSIPASAFRPSPKVISTTIIIKKRSSPLFIDIDFDDFFGVVQAAFKQSRKTIANNLSLFLNINKNQLSQITNLDLNRRAENFTTHEFYQLTKYISGLI